MNKEIHFIVDIGTFPTSDVALMTPVSKAPHLTSRNILLASDNLLCMRNQGIRIHENDRLNTRYCKLAKGMGRLSHPPDQTVFD